MSKKDKEEFTTIPNEKYKKFFDRFQEIKTLDIAQWKPVHLIAYFCKKYQETYQQEYSWKFNNPNPSKCFEVWQFNTLCAKLSANPKILKEYIDWVYQNEVPKVKTKFRSISFLTQEDRVIDYKLNVLLANGNSKLERSTLLPIVYRDLFKEVGSDISTYGDLAFISQMDPIPENINLTINKMVSMGFDVEVLRRIV